MAAGDRLVLGLGYSAWSAHLISLFGPPLGGSRRLAPVTGQVGTREVNGSLNSRLTRWRNGQESVYGPVSWSLRLFRCAHRSPFVPDSKSSERPGSQPTYIQSKCDRATSDRAARRTLETQTRIPVACFDIPPFATSNPKSSRANLAYFTRPSSVTVLARILVPRRWLLLGGRVLLVRGILRRRRAVGRSAPVLLWRWRSLRRSPRPVALGRRRLSVALGRLSVALGWLSISLRRRRAGGGTVVLVGLRRLRRGCVIASRAAGVEVAGRLALVAITVALNGLCKVGRSERRRIAGLA